VLCSKIIYDDSHNDNNSSSSSMGSQNMICQYLQQTSGEQVLQIWHATQYWQITTWTNNDTGKKQHQTTKPAKIKTTLTSNEKQPLNLSQSLTIKTYESRNININKCQQTTTPTKEFQSNPKATPMDNGQNVWYRLCINKNVDLCVNSSYWLFIALYSVFYMYQIICTTCYYTCTGTSTVYSESSLHLVYSMLYLKLYNVQ
jgi:hypothetical protein